MVSANDQKFLPLDPYAPATREVKELEKVIPQPRPEFVGPLAPAPIPTIPERELAVAPAPIVNAPLDFTYEMRRQGLLPDNWPEGVSLFQDVNLAMSNLPALKQEMLVRELLQFLPERERLSFIQDIQRATGGQVVPLTDEEWRLAHVRPTKKWYEKALGTLSSMAEKPVVAQIMDALEWPSDRMEPIFGSALYPSWSGRWWWDAPDGYSVWEHASLYYDILGTPLQHSDFSGTYVKEVDAAFLRGDPWYNDPFYGIDWENVPPQKREALQQELIAKNGAPGVYQQFQNPMMDAAFKIALDPLWLVGGLGFMPSVLRGVPILGESKLWQAALDIGEFGAIGGGKAPFKPFEAAKLAKAAALPIVGAAFRMARRIGVSGLEISKTDALIKATTYVDRSARATRQGRNVGFLARLFKTTEEYQVNALIRDSHNLVQVAAHDPRVLPKDMETFIEAVRTGKLDKLPAHMPVKFVTNKDAVKLAEILNLQKVRGNQLKTTAKTILTPEAFDVAMETALGESPKAAKKFQSLYSRGHAGWEAEFMDEALTLLSKAIGGSFNYNSMALSARIMGWNRRILTATLLDNPAFAVLNTVYNTTNAFIGHGFEAFKDGLLPRAIKRTLTDYGLPEDVIARTVGDPGLSLQMGLSMAGKVGQGARPSRFSWIHPWASMASWIDRHVRLKTTQIGIIRTFTHNWHNIATPIPKEVGAALSSDTLVHITSLADSAGEPGFLARLDTAEELIKAERPIMTTATLRDQWIDEFARIGGVPVTGDARRLIMERFNQLGLTGALDAALVADNIDDMLRAVDAVRTTAMRNIDEFRQAQHLEPISHFGDVTAENLGTTGENLYSIAIADDALGKTRVEMTDLWLQAHGFESGVAQAKLDKYLIATRAMYARWRGDIGRIQAASNAGEHGVDAMWRGYEVNRLQELTDNLTALERLIAEHNPSLLPSFRVLKDVRLSTMAAKDRALRMALEAGEDIRYYDRAELLGPTRQRIDRWINQEIRTERDLMGLAPRAREFNMGSLNATPVMGDAMTGELQWAREFINWAEPQMVHMYTAPPNGIPTATSKTALLWLDQLRGDFKDLQLTALKVGRAMTDHLWYDYARQFGGEKILAWMMPYFFWPTRTMWLWGERIVSNPGVMASIAKSYDLTEDMTSDLPERFRGNLRLPVPLVGDLMAESYGPATKMFFDPLRVMFPTAQWSQDFRSDEKAGTLAGRILDYWGTVGPGVHPFVPAAGSLVGLLDRDAWVNRNYPRSLPFGLPGTPAQMAIVAFLNGADVDLPDWLTDDDMGQLMGGTGLPLAKLQKVLGVPNDKWDTYRINRSLCGVFLEETKNMTSAQAKVALADFLRAADAKSGPYWEKARQLASTEAGIRYLTSWAFGAVQIYPESEQLMRALDPIYRMYAAKGQLDEFYERWPEYQLRQVAIASLGGEASRTEALHKALFWLDLTEALDAREQDLKPIYAALDAVQAKEEFYNTKIGRLYRSMYEEEQYQVIIKWQDEINQIYARNEDVDKTPSADNDPYTRAMMILRNEYYDIRLERFLPVGKTIDTSTQEEVLKAQEDFKTAQENFILDLSPNRIAAGVKFHAGVENQVLGIKASAAIEALARTGKGADISKVVDQRNADQLALMNTAKSMVSRYDFELFLNRSKTPPSAVEEAYKQASAEMSRYVAMNELDIPSKARRALKTNYWDNHPLLQRFYGNEPTGFSSSEAAAAYARLDEIRSEYYKRDGVAGLNYIHSVLDELNSILDTLGLPMVTLKKLGIVDGRRWDLSIPGIGLPDPGKLEYSIDKRYSDEALSVQ